VDNNVILAIIPYSNLYI